MIFGGIILVLVILAGFKTEEAKTGQVDALRNKSETLLGSNKKHDDDLEALIAGLQGGKQLEKIYWPQALLSVKVRGTLQKAVYGVKERDRLQNEKGQIISGLSIDGRKLANLEHYGFACYWDNLVCLWDKSGTRMDEFLGPHSSLDQATFSPDRSKLLIVNSTVNPGGWVNWDSSVVRLWDLKTNLPLTKFKGHQSQVWRVSFSPDGNKIAIAGNKGISLWDAEGNQIPEFKSVQGRVTDVVFSPDSSKLASVIDSTKAKGFNNVHFWDLKGQPVGQLPGELLANKVVFSPDDGTQLAATGPYGTNDFGTVSLWNMSDLSVAATILKGPHGDITFSQDGSFLVGSGEDGVARAWNLSGEQKFELKGHQTWASGVIISRDGKQLATTGVDNTVSLWDLNDKEAATFVDKDKPYRETFNMIFSPDSSLVATRGTSYEYDPNNNSPDQHPEIGRDNAISLWDLRGNKLGEIPINSGNQSRGNITISHDNQQVAVIEDKEFGKEEIVARIWNWKNKQKLEYPEPQGWSLIGVGFSDGSSLLVTYDKSHTVHLLDLESNKVTEIKDPQKNVLSVKLTPDGSKIVTVGDEGISLWDLHGKELAHFKITPDVENYYRNLIFSRDDSLVAINNKDGVSVRNQEGEEVAQFKSVTAMDFSSDHDGILLATNGGLPNSVRLWDLATQEQVAEFSTVASFAVRFSPDGKFLFTAGNSIPTLWKVESLNELMQRGCDWIRDYLARKPIDDSNKHLCD